MEVEMGKAGFRKYQQRWRFYRASELIQGKRERYQAGIDALRDFAEDLHRVDAAFEGAELKGKAFDLIRRHRPYAFVRLSGHRHFTLVDRGYEDMTGLKFSRDELEALGMTDWRKCPQTPLKWTYDGYPIIDDAFSLEWLSEAAGLIQDIAELMDSKAASAG